MNNLAHLFKIGQKVMYKNNDFDAVKKNIPCVVKEIHSDHIIITDTETDTDLWIEEGFNMDCVYPICFNKDRIYPLSLKSYEFECLLSEEYKDCHCCDEWGAATLWLNNKQGVEYNFCIDESANKICNSSAIYKMYYNEKIGTWETDWNTFEHYEINFKNANWKEELKNAMYKVAKKFYE